MLIQQQPRSKELQRQPAIKLYIPKEGPSNQSFSWNTRGRNTCSSTDKTKYFKVMAHSSKSLAYRT